MQEEPRSILERFSLAGKVALVTGGGQGIGRGYAHALGEAGAKVAVVDLLEERAKTVSAELEMKGAQSMAIQVDVTDESQVAKMVALIVEKWGRLDIGVNNAGIGSWSAAEDLSLEDWNKVMGINLTAVFLCCKAEAKVMIKQGHGKIINTASMSGSIINVPQKQSHYNTSKAAVIHLTKSLAVEWAAHDIQVNCISPGYTQTPLVCADGVKELWPDWISKTPAGRMGRVEDLQGAVVFLASEASNFMTGHDMVIDGGYTLL